MGFAFQSIGLMTTTASRSAFLLYLNVKFVPFLALILLGRKITKSTWTSALLALSGRDEFVSVCACVCMYACMYVCLYACVFVCTCMNVCMKVSSCMSVNVLYPTSHILTLHCLLTI